MEIKRSVDGETASRSAKKRWKALRSINSEGVANPVRVWEDYFEDHPVACVSHCSY